MTKQELYFFLQKCGITRDKIMRHSLGGLMYTPAHNKNVSQFLTENRYSHLRSLALCLEDAIADGTEKEAVLQTGRTFAELDDSVSRGLTDREKLPYIFVRVRRPEQINEVYDAVKGSSCLTGFIFPKFNENNAQKYLEAISNINQNADNIIYGMPILESSSVSDARCRISTLSGIKSITDSFREIVFNIRTGGNDFCSSFGVRRGINNSIYSIAAVNSIIGDIVSIFSADYVVSAPVWDYFEGPDKSASVWSDGLRNEIKLDILNGLCGKTAIHPSQLRIIDEEHAVSGEDFADAFGIMNWQDNTLAVKKGIAGNRMNEEKVHRNWAEKILVRAAVYGVNEEERKI